MYKNNTDVFCSSAGTMHVSLAEALQVRGGPLQEEEVWAVLNQSAESLHELLRRGKPSFISHHSENSHVSQGYSAVLAESLRPWTGVKLS